MRFLYVPVLAPELIDLPDQFEFKYGEAVIGGNRGRDKNRVKRIRQMIIIHNT